MRSCNGFTCRQLDRVSFGFGGKIYQNDVKFCKTCDKFMKINGYRCLCCGGNLRCKSHTKRYRENNLPSILLKKNSCVLTENSIENFRERRKV